MEAAGGAERHPLMTSDGWIVLAEGWVVEAAGGILTLDHTYHLDALSARAEIPGLQCGSRHFWQIECSSGFGRRGELFTQDDRDTTPRSFRGLKHPQQDARCHVS